MELSASRACGVVEVVISNKCIGLQSGSGSGVSNSETKYNALSVIGT